jgi:hypothetical protein
MRHASGAHLPVAGIFDLLYLNLLSAHEEAGQSSLQRRTVPIA